CVCFHIYFFFFFFFFFSSRRRHTRSLRDWSSDVCSSDLYDALDVSAKRQLEERRAVHDLDASRRRAGEPPMTDKQRAAAPPVERSEERRVGKECRSRGSAYHEKKKKQEHDGICEDKTDDS